MIKAMNNSNRFTVQSCYSSQTSQPFMCCDCTELELYTSRRFLHFIVMVMMLLFQAMSPVQLSTVQWWTQRVYSGKGPVGRRVLVNSMTRMPSECSSMVSHIVGAIGISFHKYYSVYSI